MVTTLLNTPRCFDPVVDRDKEIKRIIGILLKKTKNNSVLIGAPGVGKITVIEGFAQRIKRGDIPRNLLRVRLVALNMSALVAGFKMRGSFEERFKNVLDEVKNSQGTVILLIDELYMLHVLEKKDRASNARCLKVGSIFDNLRDKLQPLMMKNQEEIDENRKQKEKLRQSYSWEYKNSKPYAILEVEAASTDENLMLRETVGPEQIAEVLKKILVGQDDVVKGISEAVLKSRMRLGRQQQPTGSFHFLGLTGVGKTTLDKALAEELFDDKNLIVRFDMLEYMEEYLVSRLIGVSPVLDDGRLTNGYGRTIDFTDTVIIMTSNFGAQHLLAKRFLPTLTNRLRKSPKDLAMVEVRKHFHPELLNRIDEIVTLYWQSYDPLYGARPIRRWLEKKVVTQLSKMILNKEIHENTTVFTLRRIWKAKILCTELKAW
ncbi:hypothetical protein GIB67_015895 [Kingdonia uniflora]|uniref:AAA+ ATPase domain-containing protein n=1 Tax=Kingdonia uniflora TaxID=39325 RepID=A0A7J7P786_9MAGN|nr:hypothetical protein GIB67_015895 [Kingdonia uniflora]